MSERKFLLNEQISLEARRIAHAACTRCENRLRDEPASNVPGEHTRACNKLKREIEQLALTIKFTAHQPPLPSAD